MFSKVFGAGCVLLAIACTYFYIQVLSLQNDVAFLEADNNTLKTNVIQLSQNLEAEKKARVDQKAAFDIERAGNERLAGNYAAIDKELKQLQAKMAKREEQYAKAFMDPKLTARTFAIFYTRRMRKLEQITCTQDCDKDSN